MLLDGNFCIAPLFAAIIIMAMVAKMIVGRKR